MGLSDFSPQWVAIWITLAIAVASGVSARRSRLRSDEALARDRATRVAVWVDTSRNDPLLHVLNSSGLPIYDLWLEFKVRRNKEVVGLQIRVLEDGHSENPALQFRQPVVNPSERAIRYRLDFVGAFVASIERVGVSGSFTDAQGRYWVIRRGLVDIRAAREWHTPDDPEDEYESVRTLLDDLRRLWRVAGRKRERLADYVTGRPPFERSLRRERKQANREERRAR